MAEEREGEGSGERLKEQRDGERKKPGVERERVTEAGGIRVRALSAILRVWSFFYGKQGATGMIRRGDTEPALWCGECHLVAGWRRNWRGSTLEDDEISWTPRLFIAPHLGLQ